MTGERNGPGQSLTEGERVEGLMTKGPMTEGESHLQARTWVKRFLDRHRRKGEL